MCWNHKLFCEIIDYTYFVYKQLGSGLNPQSCLYFQGFGGSKLLNGCLIVWRSNLCLRGIQKFSRFKIYINTKISDFKIFLIMLFRQLNGGIWGRIAYKPVAYKKIRVNATPSNTYIRFYGLLTFFHRQIPSIPFWNKGIWTVNGGMRIKPLELENTTSWKETLTWMKFQFYPSGSLHFT